MIPGDVLQILLVHALELAYTEMPKCYMNSCYFSFVTMCTPEYNDVVQLHIAQSWAMQLLGQLIS